jgi:hypothetical protein
MASPGISTRPNRSATIPEGRHVSYNPEEGEAQRPMSQPPRVDDRRSFQSDFGPRLSPVLTRRRTSTSRNMRTANAYPARPNWHPGQEPGLDPLKPNGGRSQTPTLHTRCDITVVDFSEDDMMMRHLDNDTIEPFLKQKREDWIQCRWINVNGLSWDVIQAIGIHKRLHKLAIEDLLNTRNRTKADWYAILFIIRMQILMPQQVLRPHLHSLDPSKVGASAPGRHGQRIGLRRQ